MPIFAISILGILALVGAALALNLDSRAAANLQIAADEAALSGATSFLNTASPKAADRLEAARLAAEAAAKANANFTLANLDIGALTEDAYGQKTIIQVDLKFTPANPAAQMAGRNASIAIERGAAATATWGFPLCILALNGSKTGLSTSGNADLTADNCIVWANSTGSRSMEFTGGRAATKFFCTAGNTYIASASVTPRPDEKCDPIPDPLATWTAPAPATIEKLPFPAASMNRAPDTTALLRQVTAILNAPLIKQVTRPLINALESGTPLTDSEFQLLYAPIKTLIPILGGPSSVLGIDKAGYFTRGSAKGLHILEVVQILGAVDNLPAELLSRDSYFNSPTLTLSPGTYAGLDIMQGHVKMRPGVYHIVGAPLLVRRRATLSGEGVTIVLHGDKATFSVLDEARLELTAPTDGDTAGFAIAENRRASLKGLKPERSRLTGSGSVELIGTIYLPRQTFAITGSGAADQASPLLQLVAHTVSLNQNGALKIRFDPSRTEVPMTIQPAREARLIH